MRGLSIDLSRTWKNRPIEIPLAYGPNSSVRPHVTRKPSDLTSPNGSLGTGLFYPERPLRAPFQQKSGRILPLPFSRAIRADASPRSRIVEEMRSSSKYKDGLLSPRAGEPPRPASLGPCSSRSVIGDPITGDHGLSIIMRHARLPASPAMTPNRRPGRHCRKLEIRRASSHGPTTICCTAPLAHSRLSCHPDRVKNSSALGAQRARESSV